MTITDREDEEFRLPEKPKNLRKMTTEDEHIQHNCQRRQRVAMMIMQRTRRVKDMHNIEEEVYSLFIYAMGRMRCSELSEGESSDTVKSMQRHSTSN
jgi:hypothetical protein